jgi:hypothetical protein
MVKRTLPLLFVSVSLFADEAYDIAAKAEKTQRNFGDETVESTMQLIARMVRLWCEEPRISRSSAPAAAIIS